MIHLIVESIADHVEAKHESRYGYFNWPRPWLDAYDEVIKEFADIELPEAKKKRLRRRFFNDTKGPTR